MAIAPNLRVERKPNYLAATISVALVLFLLGAIGLFLLQGRAMLQLLREQVELIVEISTEADQSGPKEVERYLRKQEYLKVGSLRFVPKAEALEQMKEDFGTDVVALDLPNPLYDVFLFNVNANYLHPDSLAGIRAGINDLPSVTDVYYQEGIVDVLARNLRKLSWIALAVALLALLVGVVLIHNTIRLSLYSNRFLIKTQELVGASWTFISRPYLKQGLLRGAVSGVLAGIGVFALNWWMLRFAPELRHSQSGLAVIVLIIALFLLGMLINWVSTYYTVRKYLKLREDELY